MRERHLPQLKEEVDKRITPARAGKTSVGILRPASGRDHPRSCGKDQFSSNAGSLGQGSPPLVRERHHVDDFPASFEGITPARAGKTQALQIQAQQQQGSPPLVRERHYNDDGIYEHLRITPARAGKTLHPPTADIFSRDHPRSCGKDKTNRSR